MCQIFAGQDPANYAYETRSVRLMGHATSVRSSIGKRRPM